MVCPHENVIFADGHKVCTDCGLMFEHIVQYVTSYSNPSTYRRQPVYSRQKRFFHFLFKLGNKTVLKNHMRIMDVFGDIEFHYNICPPPGRQYFFNKRVVLFWIMSVLELDCEDIQTLKDKERVDTQIHALCLIAERFL